MDAESPAAGGVERTARRRAAVLSLTVGVLLLAVKFGAWFLTDSAAVLSDALESIVNVVAAGFALYSIWLSSKPADQDHPYGHGKVEFLSAAFEGGLIFLAGGLIIQQSARHLLDGTVPQRLGEGIALVGATAVVNLALGAYLIRVGRRTHSLTLVADGKHLITDVWTSGMTVVALALVLLTREVWLDPVFAIVAAMNILRIGWGLMREAVAGIMDAADPEDLAKMTQALHSIDDPTLVGWTRIRSRHQGHLHHVDLTIFVPGAATVDAGHALADRVEAVIGKALGDAEVICHVEPDASD